MIMTIAQACAEIDRLTTALDTANSDYSDLRFDLGELARENDDLRHELGRLEDRRP